MPDPDLEEKSIKRSVSLPPTLLEEAQFRADAQHGGNLSRYIQHLITADIAGLTPGDRLMSGAVALKRFGELQPGNYVARLHRAVADGRPFAEIAGNLTGGDPDLLVLLRRAYDFLARKDNEPSVSSPATPPIMTALLEIRDLLRAEGLARLPKGSRADANEIPNSPVNQFLAEEQKRRAGRAVIGGAGAKPGQSGKGTHPKARGGEG